MMTMIGRESAAVGPRVGQSVTAVSVSMQTISNFQPTVHRRHRHRGMRILSPTPILINTKNFFSSFEWVFRSVPCTCSSSGVVVCDQQHTHSSLETTFSPVAAEKKWKKCLIGRQTSDSLYNGGLHNVQWDENCHPRRLGRSPFSLIDLFLTMFCSISANFPRDFYCASLSLTRSNWGEFDDGGQ